MKISWIKQSFLAMAVIALMMSCEYEFIEVATPAPPDPNDTTVEPVLFSTQVEPIFDASGCLGCHSGSAPDLTAGNAYNTITGQGWVVAGDPAASKIYTVPHPVTGSHFATYNSTADSDLIYLWIAQGAENN